MVENKHVPDVRFARLSGNWTNMELGNVFSKIRNAFVGTATPYYVKTGHFYLESNNVKDGKINRNSEIFINEEFYQKQRNNLLKAGDLVMVQSGHVGHSAVIPPELDNTAAHALIIFSKPKEQIDSYFLNYQLQTDAQKLQISHITTGNTIKHILSSEMKKFEAFFPSFDEQTKIGELFQNLDTLINQHQTKVAQLANVKKSMLDKMFPKTGTDVPEVRFGLGHEKWQSTQIKDFCKVGDVDHRMPPSVSSGIPYVMTGDFYGINNINFENVKLVSNEDYEQLTKKIKPEFGDLLMARYASIGMVRYVETRDKFLVSYSCAIIKPSELMDGKYLFYFMQSDELQKQIKLVINTGSQPNVGIDSIKNLRVLSPSKADQTKIGQLFQNLDTLIAQNQKVLDQLKNLKQALLHKMFV